MPSEPPIDAGTVDAIGLEEVLEREASGRRLRIKLGVDPTRPDLTFGHMVVLNKLRAFQDRGHEAILLIGDYTATIGDPSGRSETRPVLTEEEIRANAETYLSQAFLLLDEERTTVRRNSEWFGGMSFADCLSLARRMTVARMLERDDFAKRYAEGNPISIVEFLYPLVQGYDSVVLEADVELGGTDQLFNMLVGRALQKERGQPEQAVLTLPLLVGLDGQKKMSKSMGNYIAFRDPAGEMFGKIMSIPDAVMEDYYRLLLGTDEDELADLRSGHPMEAKKELARRLTTLFHSAEEADRARREFEQVFSRGENPAEMREVSLAANSLGESSPVIDLLAASALFPSRKEATRLIAQGGIKRDGVPVADRGDPIGPVGEGAVYQAGKRRFFRAVP